MSAFCEPETTTSTPTRRWGGHDADARDGVEHAHGAVRGGDLGEGADVVEDAGRGLRLRAEKSLHLSPALRERALDLGGVDLLAPLGLEVDGLGPVGIAQLRPALTELPRRGHDRDIARREQVGHRGLHRARSRGREHEHLVARLEDHREASSTRA
jgi:hypothetical protein